MSLKKVADAADLVILRCCINQGSAGWTFPGPYQTVFVRVERIGLHINGGGLRDFGRMINFIMANETFTLMSGDADPPAHLLGLPLNATQTTMELLS